MEMCLGDQQFVMLLLYLDSICQFVASIDKMLDRLEMVFRWLEGFNLNICLKYLSFQHSMVFLEHVLSADGISASPAKVDEVKKWLVPKNQKELHSFLGLVSYYWYFISNSATIARQLHQLISRKETKADMTSNTFVWTDKQKGAFELQ